MKTAQVTESDIVFCDAVPAPSDLRFSVYKSLTNWSRDNGAPISATAVLCVDSGLFEGHGRNEGEPESSVDLAKWLGSLFTPRLTRSKTIEPFGSAISGLDFVTPSIAILSPPADSDSHGNNEPKDVRVERIGPFGEIYVDIPIEFAKLPDEVKRSKIAAALNGQSHVSPSITFEENDTSALDLIDESEEESQSPDLSAYVNPPFQISEEDYKKYIIGRANLPLDSVLYDD